MTPTGRRSLRAATLALLAASCTGTDRAPGAGATTPPASPPAPAPISGDAAPGTASEPRLVPLAIGDGCSRLGRDLAFNPATPGELWVLSKRRVQGATSDDSLCVIEGATGPSPGGHTYADMLGADHWTANMGAIAFASPAAGAPMEIRYRDSRGVERLERDLAPPGIPGTPFGVALDAPGWQGHSLYSSQTFRVRPPGIQTPHYDMLHQSPHSVGIAWEKDRVFWVFAGERGEIVRYDDKTHHGPGGEDHGVCSISHWATGALRRVRGLSSHVFLHAPSAMLYIADTGNHRVVRLDTRSGRRGRDAAIGPEEQGATAERKATGLYEHYMQDEAVLAEFVPASAGLLAPSGVEIQDDVVHVSDAGDGTIHTFDLQGRPLGLIATGAAPNALSGMAFGPDRRLYYVDSQRSQVVRIER